jgi:hypothetical protein
MGGLSTTQTPAIKMAIIILSIFIMATRIANPNKKEKKDIKQMKNEYFLIL